LPDTLHWLAEHADLSAAIRDAKTVTGEAERLALAASLAGYRRDFTLTGRIDKLAAAGLESERAPPGLHPLRLALLSSHTVDHLLPSIRVAGLYRRLALSLYVTPYGMYRQALLGSDPALEAFAPQVIVLALDAHDSPLQLPLDATEDNVAAAIEKYVDGLRTLWHRARERYSAQVVQQTLVPTAPSVFGGFDGLVPGSPTALLERLNTRIRSVARQDGVLLLDLAWHVAQPGQGDGLGDPVRWHQAKQLVSPIFAPLYGDLVARLAAAVAGLSRKCLVLDLDNTLWGGVIGDDGIDGIRLGQGHPIGEAFASFQAYVSLLGRRGVVLAVCSKNDDAVAQAAFSHPEMVLKRSEIAAFVANWNDKAGNLRQIAAQLNIGLDSLVFVDDNPAERDIVRRELPEVAVPELPEDVALYPACLASAGYFEAVSFTADDAARGRSYAQNEARRAESNIATDMPAYLRSLNMRLVATPVGSQELPRVTQLINKTNQFNLTTRRYTEAQVQNLASDPACVALALRLIDKYGDNGLISVVIARPDPRLPPEELFIDTWLMSCRVLGRQVEEAVLDVVADAAGQRGARALIGQYRSTPRNAMVAEHYPRLGFSTHSTAPVAEPDSTFWRCELNARPSLQHHIEIGQP
jgi:FkbH-like protein